MGTKVIPREARTITYSTRIRNLRKGLVLTDFQRSVVIGTILGDGTLVEGWPNTGSYKLGIRHSIKQLEYVIWKYRTLRNCVASMPKYYTKTNSVSFRTISHPIFTELRGIFYKENRKVIPGNIESLLDPVVLAVWFMDDGNRIRRNNKLTGLNINSHSFSLEENNILLSALASKFDISGSIDKNKGKHRIGIFNKGSARIFIELIESYVLGSMKYKIG